MVVSILRKIFKRHEEPRGSEVFLFNTLHREKELFRPLYRARVSMYHCGPTVYNYQHIGNYRSYILSDTLKRLFRYRGYTVNQVINITDVGHLTGDNSGDADTGEDRIEEGAKREHKTAAEVVKFYSDDFLATLEKLNVDTEGTQFPKATEHILEQIAFIKTLEEKGYTYRTSDGIYFDTSLFKNYGALGKVNLAGLQEGKRIGVNPEKKHPTDFALWKFSVPRNSASSQRVSAAAQRQQEWESPWGTGFPGWHIECSAMSTKFLGHHFDIHTGGIDHISVHHQNEIAQSEAAFGKPFVNYWLHNAHITVDGKKISKSIGNVILPSHLEARGIPLVAYRYWLLTAHYRSSVNFTWEALEGAHRAFFKLQRYFVEELGIQKGNVHEKYHASFLKSVSDDLDTPRALASVWNLIKDEQVSKPDKKATLLDVDKMLGLNLSGAQEFLEETSKKVPPREIPPEVQKLMAAREQARAAGDFKTADNLRDQIKSAGLEITDTDAGPSLTKVK